MKTFEIILGLSPLRTKKIICDLSDGICQVINIYTEQKQYIGEKINDNGDKKYGSFSVIDDNYFIIDDFIYDKIIPFYGEEFVNKHYGESNKTAYINNNGNVYMLV